MKKILTFLAMTASILMVSVSCHKNNDDDEEEGGGSSEYVAPIKIDGDFSDWAKITGFAESKTSRCRSCHRSTRTQRARRSRPWRRQDRHGLRTGVRSRRRRTGRHNRR